MATAAERWWKAKRDQVASAITGEISTIETTQLDLYEHYYYLGLLYDPYDYVSRAFFTPEQDFETTENVCASNVDTVTSVAARQTIRPVFLTDEGDWETKRRAADLGRFGEGVAKLIRLDELKPRIFKDGAIFGYGLVRYEMDEQGVVTHDRFLPVEVRVSEEECLSQPPRQLHLLKHRDRDYLMAKYPDHAEALETTPKDTTGSFFGVVGMNSSDQILVRESWRLPVGTFGKPGYRPGRKVVSTAELVLVDEPYDDDRFPIAVLRWNERTTGWAGSGLIEGQMGLQRTINKMHQAFDAQIDLHASPVTFVNPHDLAAIEKMRTTEIGRLVPVVGERPKTEIPPVIAPEAERRLERLSNLSRTNSGISDMHAHGAMPARLETGAAVRESNDVASERFAIPEKALERWYLDSIEIVIMLCKRNHTKGLKTPDIGYSFLVIKKRIKWVDVDMKDVTYWIQTTPQLSRTLAGRMDTIANWQASGLITPQQALHLINHPDLDDAMSRYDSYLEYIDRVAQLLLDGEFVPPDPRGDLMGIGLDAMKGHYFDAMNDGAEEDRVENVRTWMDQAAYIVAKANAAAAPPPPAPGMAPAAMAA